MSAALSKALLWLVMLAIPLQGIAAAGMMLPRAPGHGGMQMQMQVQHASAKSMHSDMDGVSKASYSSQDCAGMPGCDHPRAPGLLKCGLSAACSLVAAPSLQMPAFLQAGSSQSPSLLAATLSVVFCTGAPDRPPRSLA